MSCLVVVSKRFLPEVFLETALNRTLERLYPSMSPLVVIQVSFRFESLGALFAFVRCVASMNSLMDIVIAYALKVLPAGTNEGKELRLEDYLTQWA